MAHTAQTQPRYPRGSEGGAGGRFAPTRRPDPVENDDLSSSGAEVESRAIAAQALLTDAIHDLASEARRPDLSVREAAGVWTEANALTSLLNRSTTSLCVDVANEGGKYSAGSEVPFVDADGQEWKMKVGEARPRYDEEKLRRKFLEEADDLTADEVVTLASRYWVSSGWNGKNLTDEGISLDSAVVITPRALSVVPEDAAMEAGCKAYAKHVSEATAVGTPRERLAVSKSLHAAADNAKSQAAASLIESSGFDMDDRPKEITGDRDAEGFAQKLCTLRTSYGHKQWQTGEIFDRIKEKARGNPRRMAQIIANSHQRGKWRTGVPALKGAVLPSESPTVKVSRIAEPQAA